MNYYSKTIERPIFPYTSPEQTGKPGKFLLTACTNLLLQSQKYNPTEDEELNPELLKDPAYFIR